MKKIKLNQKLNLNKSVVSKLNNEESAVIIGGSSPTHCFCEDSKWVKCDVKTKRKKCDIIVSKRKTCYMCDDISHATQVPYC